MNVTMHWEISAKSATTWKRGRTTFEEKKKHQTYPEMSVWKLDYTTVRLKPRKSR